MIGFEYGIYRPGDSCWIEGGDRWRVIARCDSIIVYFTDDSSCKPEDIKRVRLAGKPKPQKPRP